VVVERELDEPAGLERISVSDFQSVAVRERGKQVEQKPSSSSMMYGAVVERELDEPAGLERISVPKLLVLDTMRSSSGNLVL
jgi:hypothetical protein